MNLCVREKSTEADAVPPPPGEPPWLDPLERYLATSGPVGEPALMKPTGACHPALLPMGLPENPPLLAAPTPFEPIESFEGLATGTGEVKASWAGEGCRSKVTEVTR